jgi:hypothetical protein
MVIYEDLDQPQVRPEDIERGFTLEEIPSIRMEA